jgi:hypothetical protein
MCHFLLLFLFLQYISIHLFGSAVMEVFKYAMQNFAGGRKGSDRQPSVVDQASGFALRTKLENHLVWEM